MDALWYHSGRTIMTPTRAAAYLGTGVLLLAWLSAAAGVGEHPQESPQAPQPIQTAGTETLANDVQAQAARLRDRLSAAPAPQSPVRNPFAFAPRPEPPRPRATTRVDATPVAPLFPDPPLSLVGVAEDTTPGGKVRTAIITADGGELFMVSVGQQIGARYIVRTIGDDAVELTDLMTGAVRRIALP
jgi:hypothetical protein